MLSKTGWVGCNSLPRPFDGRLTFILKLVVTGERVESEWMLSNLPVGHNTRVVNRVKRTNLALIISMASSKLSTGMIGKMGPNISLKPDVRTTEYVRGDLSHSAISGSSDATPRTIVGAMYLVGGSVSPPRTIVPLVLSNNPLTRAKYASVGARARDSFVGPSGKNSEILMHRVSHPDPVATNGRSTYISFISATSASSPSFGTSTYSGAVQVY